MSEILHEPNDKELVLIDLSSIAHPIWHMSAAEPDPNHASQAIVARVRALANSHPHVAICCDAGRSFRKDIADTYKANRPPAEAMLGHQITLACEQLQADGFPVWSVKGFEADDLIASATACALASSPDRTVLVVSADKDLLQLVGPRVRAMSSRDGAVLDADAVYVKLGVRPEQVRDYLALVGDAADNVKGADSIGPKTAADLLTAFGSIDGIYAALREQPTRFKPAKSTALKAFAAAPPDGVSPLQLARELVTLRDDVQVPFTDIFMPRVPKDVATFGMDEEEELHQPTAERPGQSEADRVDAAEEKVTDLTGDSASRQTALTLLDTAAPAPAEYERQLDPRSMKDAISLAKNMFESRMFSAYGTPQAVLSTVMLGRELGLPAMASLRGTHIIEGRHSLAASTMVALVLKSGLAEYFRPVKFSDQEATYITLRKGPGNEPITLTHTIEMARQAWPKSKLDWEKAFLASGWGRNPTDMLVARATARLARMVYPDLLAGLYTPEELIEVREAA